MRSTTFAESLVRILNLRPERRQYIPMSTLKVRPSSDLNEPDAMRRDFESVGHDIRYAMQQHGQASR